MYPNLDGGNGKGVGEAEQGRSGQGRTDGWWNFVLQTWSRALTEDRMEKNLIMTIQESPYFLSPLIFG